MRPIPELINQAAANLSSCSTDVPLREYLPRTPCQRAAAPCTIEASGLSGPIEDRSEWPQGTRVEVYFDRAISGPGSSGARRGTRVGGWDAGTVIDSSQMDSDEPHCVKFDATVDEPFGITYPCDLDRLQLHQLLRRPGGVTAAAPPRVRLPNVRQCFHRSTSLLGHLKGGTLSVDPKRPSEPASPKSDTAVRSSLTLALHDGLLNSPSMPSNVAGTRRPCGVHLHRKLLSATPPVLFPTPSLPPSNAPPTPLPPSLTLSDSLSISLSVSPSRSLLSLSLCMSRSSLSLSLSLSLSFSLSYDGKPAQRPPAAKGGMGGGGGGGQGVSPCLHSSLLPTCARMWGCAGRC